MFSSLFNVDLSKQGGSYILGRAQFLRLLTRITLANVSPCLDHKVCLKVQLSFYLQVSREKKAAPSDVRPIIAVWRAEDRERARG